MKQTGIWLDKDEAVIVTIESGVETVRKVRSNIEHFNASGGSGTRLKGGPQDVVQDSKFLEREKHQLRLYFKAVVSELKNIDALALFGPAGTNDKFSKELFKHYKAIGEKLIMVQKTDSMTENQIRALVRDFFISRD